MDTDDAGPSDAGSVSGYSELGSISSQLPSSDTLGYAAMMLAEAELRLEGATRQEQETDAMLLLARREHGELKEQNSALRAARDVLRKKIIAKRRGKAQELAVGAHFSEAYDWVCEITKLTDVSQGGWKLQYSDNFLKNMTDAERLMLIGNPNEQDDGSDDGSIADSLSGDLKDPGWSGAVVAVLGLFDKGKTFVLNPTPTPNPNPNHNHNPNPNPSPNPNPNPNPNLNPNPNPNPNQARRSCSTT